jgi:hypothetical protein
MMDSLYLAWQYIRFNKFKTIILVASITLIAVLPLILETLLTESERQLLDRAESTPLLVGTKGSALDLAMNSLYFDDEVPEMMTMDASERIYDTELALPLRTLQGTWLSDRRDNFGLFRSPQAFHRPGAAPDHAWRLRAWRQSRRKTRHGTG